MNGEQHAAVAPGLNTQVISSQRLDNRDQILEARSPTFYFQLVILGTKDESSIEVRKDGDSLIVRQFVFATTTIRCANLVSGGTTGSRG